MSTQPLLESIHVKEFLSAEQIDHLSICIHNCSQLLQHTGTRKGDRFEGKLLSNNLDWDYYADNSWANQIRRLLDPKFKEIFSQPQTIFHSHILESIVPYQLHTDHYHEDSEYQSSRYTILIPLENYNSKTVVFNEYQMETNDFENFKRNQLPATTLKIDPKFCNEYLSHLHPADLKYLTIKETFEWRKGDLFAMDRRYFHCSDNFVKKGIEKKLGIVIWTGIPIK